MSAGLTATIIEWGSKKLPNEKIKPPLTANQILFLKLVWMNNSRIRVRFKGSCLKQDKVTYNPRNAVNWFIDYELDR